MGLSIYVHQNIQKVPDDATDEDFQVHPYEAYGDRVRNLETNAKYKVGKSIFIFSYSYHGHHDFRGALSELIGKERNFWQIDISEDCPFFELLCFTDSDACLDWESSKNLYADFVAYRDLADKKFDSGDWTCYNYWLEAFRLGKKKNSVVQLG
ncbi:MAG: hypothetical protein U5L45_03065 [Saprospiraceae bacterium]|nr:hypothetical protein [Saprospiraceae bacterium]